MAFWTSAESEPLRKFRFKIQFGEKSDDIIWWAKSVTQPSPDISMSEYQIINHKIKYPGIVTWNDIDIVFVDIDSKGFALLDILEKYGYGRDGQNDGLMKNLPPQNKITEPLFNLIIEKIDSKGVVQETWELTNPFIKSIKYGDLDYSSDELLEATLTVAYDSATLT